MLSGGSSKTLMIVCVNPAQPFAGETNCSLAFATNVNNVALGRAKRNVMFDVKDGSPTDLDASGVLARVCVCVCVCSRVLI